MGWHKGRRASKRRQTTARAPITFALALTLTIALGALGPLAAQRPDAPGADRFNRIFALPPFAPPTPEGTRNNLQRPCNYLLAL